MNRLFSSRIRRRSFLLGAALTSFAGLTWASQRQLKWSDYPFSLGVASGEPRPNSVVLWTRLAPNPLEPSSMPPLNVSVQWQVAADEGMKQVVATGEAIATPQLAHSVHVVVEGLEPGRWYWYQFKAGGELSPIGRTCTAPDGIVEQITFAFANCQNWQTGYYPAYKHLAQEDLNFVVFLGDYIYEGGPKANAPRQHNGGDCLTLEDYRRRYALYKSDPHLQAAHAAFPWIVTWDDHEVDNNYASQYAEDEQSRAKFLRRRAQAYQAYYEHMPLRPSLWRNGSIKLYRRFSFGNLAQFNILDTRQYRTDQPCGDGPKPRCPQALDEEATLLGSQQEWWLIQGLAQSSARWNVLAQQIMMAQFGFRILEQQRVFNVDQWDGYVAARTRLLNFIRQQQPSNLVVITGDLHSSWVNHLTDFDNPNSAIVGTEFVGLPISSNFPTEYVPLIEAFLSENPHVQFFEGTAHGYVRCRLTPQRWQSDYQAVSSLEPNASIRTLASFVIEDGQPVQPL